MVARLLLAGVAFVALTGAAQPTGTPAQADPATVNAAPEQETSPPAEGGETAGEEGAADDAAAQATDGKVEVPRSIADCQPRPDNRGRVRNPHPNDWTMYSLCAARMIGSSDDAVALEALNRSDELGRASGDIVFEGNVGVRNAMMRAYLLNAGGRRDEALAEIERVRNVRRYSMSVQWGLDRLIASFDGTLPRYFELASARVPDHPDLLRLMFLVNLLRGNMEAALPFAQSMSIENPRPQGGWQTADGSPVQQLAITTEINAMRAYVFAANGRAAESRALLNSIDREIADYVGAVPVAEAGRDVPRRQLQAYQTRQRTGSAMEVVIDRWKQAMAARARLTGGARMTLAQLNQQFPQAARTAASLDLVRLVATEGATDTNQRNAALEQIDEQTLNNFVRVGRRELSALLPEIETLERYPRFARGGGLLGGGDTGYTQSVEEGTGIRTIRFGTVSGSQTTADELTLLAAAETAQREGFDSFILLSRRNLERTLRIIGPYGGGGTQDRGSEGQVRVLFTNSAALPAEWQAQRSRVILASDVIAALRGRQDAIEVARSTASRQRRR